MRMRRARREVYRVHDAEEFLVEAGVDEVLEPAPLSVGGRRLQHLVGAMTMVVAVGSLGGLLALVGLSGAGRRARSGRALAASGAPVASRIVRTPAGHRRQPAPNAREYPPRGRDASRTLHPFAVDRRARRVVAAVVPRRSVSSIPVKAVGRVARVASADSQPPEFGFER